MTAFCGTKPAPFAHSQTPISSYGELQHRHCQPPAVQCSLGPELCHPHTSSNTVDGCWLCVVDDGPFAENTHHTVGAFLFVLLGGCLVLYIYFFKLTSLRITNQIRVESQEQK